MQLLSARRCLCGTGNGLAMIGSLFGRIFTHSWWMQVLLVVVMVVVLLEWPSFGAVVFRQASTENIH